MAIVGSAEIVVRAITNKVKDDIIKGFKDARSAIGAEGEAAGQSWSDGFKKSLGKGVDNAVKDALNSPDMDKSASDSGKNAGSIFSNSVADEIGKADFGSPLTTKFGEAMQEVRKVTESSVESTSHTVESRMTEAGSRGGKGFVEGFVNSGFADAAVSASSQFTTMVVSANVLGPAIASLVSAISSVVSGLFAMGAAASQAVGALAVLPAMMAVAAQGMVALKLAFQGVGAAISAGFKDQSAIKQTNTAAVTAANQVADAHKALAKAYQQAGDAGYDANQRVADSERTLKSAQQDLTVAQKELTAAHAAGREELQQLAFSAEEAALGQQRAGLRLEDARAKLVAAQDLPVNDRGRREAQLNFKEAELAYRESKDRNSDLRKEQNKAAKNGIEGTKAVSAARQKVNDAEKRRNTAAEAVDKAKLARDRQQRDSAQSIADAQDRLTRATTALAAAQKKGSTTQNAYQQALKALGPEQRKFVKYMVSQKKEFDSLKRAAGQDLFGPLQKSMGDIIKNVFPILRTNLKTTGGLLGQAALGLSEVFNPKHGKEANRLGQVMKGNNEILKVFTQRGKGGENTFSKMARLALRFLAAVQPLTKRFAEWIAKLADSGEKSTRSGDAMKRLTAFFNKAGDVAAQLGRIFGNLFKAIFTLGKAAQPAGQGLLNSFEKATEALNKFLTQPGKHKELVKFFKNSAENLKAIGRLVVKVAGAFFSMGDNKGVGKLADGLIPAVDNFKAMGDNLTAAGPHLAGLVVNFSKLMKALTAGGGLGKFIDNLSAMVGWLADAAGSDFGKKVLTWGGYISAFTHTVSFMFKPLKFLFLALTGGPIAVIRAFFKLKSFLGRLPAAFKLLRSDGIKAAFKRMTESSDKVKTAFQRQMEVDEQKRAVLQQLEAQALLTAGALDKAQQAGLPGATSVQAAEGEAAAAAGAAGPVKKEAKVAAGAAETGALGAAGAAGAAGKVDNVISPAAEKKVAKSAGIFGKLGKVLKPLGVLMLGLVGIGPEMAAGFGAAVAAAAPLIAIIAAVIAVFVGLIFFFKALYKHSPEFKKFIDGIVGKFKEFIGFIQKVVGAGLALFGKAFGDVMTKHVFPALNSFFRVVNDVMPKIGAIIGTVFRVIGRIIKNFFVPIIVNIVLPYLRILWKVWTTVFKVLWFSAKVAFAIIKFHITHVLIPVLKAIWTIVKFVWNNGVRPVFNSIRDKIKTVISVIGWYWKNILKPDLEAMKQGFVLLRDKVRTIVENIKTKWDEFITKFKRIKNRVGTLVQGIKDFFTGIPDSISHIFDNLGELAKNGLNGLIRYINDHFLGKAGKILGKVGIKIGLIPELAEGGRVTGRGGPREDNQLRRLSVGEYVLPTHVARKIGYQTLDQIRRQGGPGRPFNLAQGAIVAARPGGVHAVVAEAGRSERVEPLDRRGFSARDRMMLNLIRDQLSDRKGGDVYHIHPSPGMNESELAHKVITKTRFVRRAGR